jgi:hypothetical protein
MVQSTAAPAFAGGMVFGFLGVILLTLASLWQIFNKAGEAGWKSLVPIYGMVVFQRILGRPGWWALLMFVPVVNVLIGLVECFDLARVFGKGAGTALGLILLSPVFFAWLAFGPATYGAPNGAPRVPARAKAA